MYIRDFSGLISVEVMKRHENADSFPAFSQSLRTAPVHTVFLISRITRANQTINILIRLPVIRVKLASGMSSETLEKLQPVYARMSKSYIKLQPRKPDKKSSNHLFCDASMCVSFTWMLAMSSNSYSIILMDTHVPAKPV